MAVIFAILLFSFLIFIHEFGHFIAAKLSGVQVNEFSMFMGPAIFKKQKGETLYSIRCIPIGGYCAMEGEDGQSDNPRAFGKAAWWKRLIILVAGSGMNLIAGVLIMLIIFMPTESVVSPVIESFAPYSTLDDNGLQVGDKFLELDGEKIYVRADFDMILSLNPGDVHDVVVERNGEKVVLNDLLMERHLVVDDAGNETMLYGMSFTNMQLTFPMKLEYALNNCIDTVRNVRLSLQMLITGKAGFQDMSGPVGIVQIMSDTAQQSATTLDAVMNMLYFGGFLAINLAVMNMLPIPALDGGRVVCLLLTTAYEAITKKKIDPKYEGYLHGVGMILLLALMAFIMFKDIFVIFKG